MLPALELKVPPPLLALSIALAMWGISALTEPLPLAAVHRAAAAGLVAAIGASFSIMGMLAFRRARTTVNPLHPDRASALVHSGVYRITRNPMYVGLAFILSALAIWLLNAWTLLGPLAFILYITRFQILPEERALSAKFGAEYAAYRARVRRWL